MERAVRTKKKGDRLLFVEQFYTLEINYHCECFMTISNNMSFVYTKCFITGNLYFSSITKPSLCSIAQLIYPTLNAPGEFTLCHCLYSLDRGAINITASSVLQYQDD